MKNLIRKILRESWSKDPEWVDKFNKSSREERIEFIEDKKRYIEKLIPKISKYFKIKFGKKLDKIVVHKKWVMYGHERHDTEQIYLNFYFHDVGPDLDYWSVKKSIIRDLSLVFNLDIEYYGIPLNVEFFEKKSSSVSDEFNPKDYHRFGP